MKEIADIIKSSIDLHGIEILQQDHRLKAILADLLPHEKRMRFLIELSFRAEIPQKLLTIQNYPVVSYYAQLNNIKHYFQIEYSIDATIVDDLFKFWLDIIPRSRISTFTNLETNFGPDDSYKIVSKCKHCSEREWREEIYGYRNSTGQMITVYKYKYASPFRDGYALVKIDDKFGFIDRSGQEVIPLIYEHAESFNNGLASVKLKGKYGFINRDGDTVIPFKFDAAESFSEGLACIKIEGKYGYINAAGDTVIPIKYFGAQNFQNGLASVATKGYTEGQQIWRVIDKNGITQSFRSSYHPIKFNEGLAIIRESRGFSCVNLNGETIFERGYPHYRVYKEGRLVVGSGFLYTEAEWNYLDMRGNTINSDKYSDAYDFNEGYAFAKLDGYYGFIDQNGRQVTPFKYSSVNYPGFNNGVAIVSFTDRSGLPSITKFGSIDKNCKEVVPFKYDELYDFTEDMACVCQNKKYGFINRLGELVIPCIYDIRTQFVNGLANVRLNFKWGCIDKMGNWIEDLD